MKKKAFTSATNHARCASKRRTVGLVAAVAALIGVTGCEPDYDALGAGGSLSDAGAGGTAGGSSGAPAQRGGSAGTAAGGTRTMGGAPSAGGSSSGGAENLDDSGAGGEHEVGGESGAGGAHSGGVGGEAGAAQGGQPMEAEGGAAGAAGSAEPRLELVASASTWEFGNVPSKAIDGHSATKWCALNEKLPQWWQVDLGEVKEFTSFEVEWETPLRHGYRLEVSDDELSFSVLLENTSNPKVTQKQSEYVSGRGRYVRVFFTYLPPNDPSPHWACIREFTVFTQ